MLLDENEDEKVSMPEVNLYISSMLDEDVEVDKGGKGSSSKADNDDNDNNGRVLTLKGLKKMAPTIFKLLDANNDDELSQAEFQFVSRFEETLLRNHGEGHSMQNLIVKVFGYIDKNNDDKLTAYEIMDASTSETALRRTAEAFHELFPVRRTPDEIKAIFKDKLLMSFGTDGMSFYDAVSIMEWMDMDRDGYVAAKEVGRKYSLAVREWLAMSKGLKQYGPYWALFGGGGGEL